MPGPQILREASSPLCVNNKNSNSRGLIEPSVDRELGQPLHSRRGSAHWATLLDPMLRSWIVTGPDLGTGSDAVSMLGVRPSEICLAAISPVAPMTLS